LDPTFGLGGIAETVFPYPNAVAADMTVDPDGRIIVVGSAWSQESGDFWARVVLTRYEADGALDPTFGVGGVVETGFGGAWDSAVSVARQPDGKLLVGGSTGPVPWNGPAHLALLRLNADGSRDSTFGNNGTVRTHIEESVSSAARAVVPLQNGGLIVAGVAIYSSPYSTGILAQYDSLGALDAEFGDGGVVREQFGAGPDTQARVAAGSLTPDGRIVICGRLEAPGPSLALARYFPNGEIDTSFGVNGRVRLPGDVHPAQLEVLAEADDAILVGAWGRVAEGPAFALYRFLDSGAPDAAFGTGGIATTRVEGHDSGMSGFALQHDGRIVGAGHSSSGVSSYRIALARFWPDGGLDTTFGSAGTTTTPVGELAVGIGVQLQSDGRIVVAGYSRPSSIVVARYTNTTVSSEPEPQQPIAGLSVLPNPSDRHARVRIDIVRAGFVRLRVVDLLGRELKRPFEGWATPGASDYDIDVSGLGPGVYHIQLVTMTGSVSRRLTVAR
jgi:uncharacterized delta-60 repeat protein